MVALTRLQKETGLYRTGWPWWVHITLAYATLTSWTAILSMSLATVDRWPRSGWFGNADRFCVFLAAAFITRATITNHETRIQVACWAVVALIVGLARRHVSGRSNGIMGWTSSIAGAALGAVTARQIAHALHWNNNW